MEEIFLSIIVPVYNSERYIERCLNSILQQDLNKSLFEVICVDDGSSDSSVQIIKERICGQYNNVKVFTKENGGASSARNFGIKKAKGKYIWFVDSDDYILPNCLKFLLEILVEQDPDLLSFSIYSEKWLGTESVMKFDYEPNFVAESYTFCNLVKLKILKKENLFFNEEIKYGEDTLFWYIVNIYTKKMIRLKKNIYYYEINENSIMQSLKEDKNICRRVEDMLKANKILKGY